MGDPIDESERLEPLVTNRHIESDVKESPDKKRDKEA